MLAESSAQLALAASERDATSARASLEFLTDALSAASPDTAMSTQVRVRDLLDAARRKHEARRQDRLQLYPAHAAVARLALLQLGETRIARDLLRDGLADVVFPRDSVDALRLARLRRLFRFSGSRGRRRGPRGARRRRNGASNMRRKMTAACAFVAELGMVFHRDGKDENAIDCCSRPTNSALINRFPTIDFV